MYVSETRVGWRFTDVLASAVRGLAFGVLLVGLSSVVLSFDPLRRSTDDLVADIASGQVTYVEYRPGFDEIRWSTGYWEWRETSPPHDFSNDPGVTREQQVMRWLKAQDAGSDRPLIVHTARTQQSRFWPGHVRWQPMQVLVTVAWLGTFLVMLATSGHRYANRWAWFWLFTVGQVGVLLYLLFEPRPIWRPSSRMQPPGRATTTGGQGCAWSILLSILGPFAALALSKLIAWLIAAVGQ
jgi:hypothetical protein